MNRPTIRPGAVVSKARPISADRSVLGNIVGSLFLIVIGGLLVSCVLTIAIWPGEVKLVAPLFCTDAQPDPFVVADTYSPQPGETVTNFSLYCMGPRGDSTDHGFMVPFLMISVVNGVILMTLFVILGKLGSRAARRSTGPKIPLAHRIEESREPTDADPFDAPTGAAVRQPAPSVDHSGLFDEPDEPRRPNQAPPGSTPGPFVD